MSPYVFHGLWPLGRLNLRGISRGAPSDHFPTRSFHPLIAGRIREPITRDAGADPASPLFQTVVTCMPLPPGKLPLPATLDETPHPHSFPPSAPPARRPHAAPARRTPLPPRYPLPPSQPLSLRPHRPTRRRTNGRSPVSPSSPTRHSRQHRDPSSSHVTHHLFTGPWSALGRALTLARRGTTTHPPSLALT
jgi:hypothetical protein